MFTTLDVAHLTVWLVFSYFPITHRSPWGFWSTAARNWFRKRRTQGGGGPGEEAYGTLWLFTHGLVALAAFFYFREPVNQTDQGLFIASYVLVVANVVFTKMWAVLFFDYRDATAALWMALCVDATGIALAVLAGLAQSWVAMSLHIAHTLWFVYLTGVSWKWHTLYGLNRKEARALDVEGRAPESRVPLVHRSADSARHGGGGGRW